MVRGWGGKSKEFNMVQDCSHTLLPNFISHALSMTDGSQLNTTQFCNGAKVIQIQWNHTLILISSQREAICSRISYGYVVVGHSLVMLGTGSESQLQISPMIAGKQPIHLQPYCSSLSGQCSNYKNYSVLYYKILCVRLFCPTLG